MPGLTAEEEQDLRGRMASVLARMQSASRKAAEAGLALAGNEKAVLVAISKRQPVEKLAVVAGAWKALAPDQPVIFGENYIQEGISKQEALRELLPNDPPAAVRWHFTGHLQSNKAKLLPGRFELLHTLDSLSLAQNLQKNMRTGGATAVQKALIQVNIGEEAQKSGVAPEDAAAFIKALAAFPAISVHGLMCLPPITGRAEDSRPFFYRLRQLRDSLERNLGLALPHLSMGMSQDFEIALEEGASIIRVGTDLFGERK
ncbi:MAG: YggS family pyridoxal phosphate-dependent enzyme [Deltaproteobacteria bacterium]|jgi:pyridoxal phosphate enzyme (YggS family)|nr:YggS family pyridoxal phosphate-dependent enzyme [Deltaproteobacteria bacterium]